MNNKDKIMELSKIERCPNCKIHCENIKRACQQMAEFKDKAFIKEIEDILRREDYPALKELLIKLKYNHKWN